MRNKTQTWEMTLISPLHIGDGTRLQRDMDFLTAGNRVEIIDPDSIIDQVRDNPFLLKELGRIGFNLKVLNHDYHITPFPAYILENKGDKPEKEIFRFIKDAFGRPYAPGSSIKGAINKALWTTLDRSHLPRAVNYRDFVSEVRKIEGRDPQHNFIRPLIVSDSDPVSPSENLICQEIKFFNVRNGDKAGWKSFSGRGNPTKDRFEEAVGIHLEALRPGVRLIFETGISDFLLQPAVMRALTLPKCQGLGSVGELAVVLNMHAQRIAQSELDFFKRFKQAVQGVIDFYEKLLNQIGTILNGPVPAFFLRLSWGSGWRGMTGNWISDDDIVSVRRAEKLGKMGCPKCHGTYSKDNRQRGFLICNSCGQSFRENEIWVLPTFPKTRRIAMHDGFPSLPLGWVMVKAVGKERFGKAALKPDSARMIRHGESKQDSDGNGSETSKEGHLNQSPTMQISREAVLETWETAILKYTPNDGFITATFEGAKAITKSRELVPPELHSKLFDKRKAVSARVVIEKDGNHNILKTIKGPSKD